MALSPLVPACQAPAYVLFIAGLHSLQGFARLFVLRPSLRPLGWRLLPSACWVAYHVTASPCAMAAPQVPLAHTLVTSSTVDVCPLYLRYHPSRMESLFQMHTHWAPSALAAGLWFTYSSPIGRPVPAIGSLPCRLPIGMVSCISYSVDPPTLLVLSFPRGSRSYLLTMSPASCLSALLRHPYLTVITLDHLPSPHQPIA
jgi:hypothetical protein